MICIFFCIEIVQKFIFYEHVFLMILLIKKYKYYEWA